ncbi:MAG TPA: diaminopimelate decarboxylase [Rhodothermia bacterium]|nr:diaminopimelate decarboxylase [Rhodothermia bacterium]
MGKGVLKLGVDAAARKATDTRPPPAPGFTREGSLVCDGVSLEMIAAEIGTPAYVYSAPAIRHQYQRLAGALEGLPHRLHYSVKANSNLAILGVLQKLGAGVDIVSGGELYRALSSGFLGPDIVFSGVGKTRRELEEALTVGVLLINVESEDELALLDRIAGEMKVIAPVALRVNPEVMVDTPHPYTRTGVKGMKFGIPFDETLVVAKQALDMKNVRLVGLDMHVGSQISKFQPYEIGLGRLLQLHWEIKVAGASELRYLDIGGGLAVTYDAEHPIDIEGFGASIKRMVKPTGLDLIFEPGRFLVGNSGVLLTRVLYRKRSGGKEFIIIDAGMNDLLRPSHYNAFHRIEAVTPRGGKVTADVVGPICESGDFFGLQREVDDVLPGDLMVVRSAGAYGFAMSSNYNSRPRAAEVLVDRGCFGIVTEREDYPDLVRKERLEPDWRSV